MSDTVLEAPNISAPIYKVPPEILITIFELLTPQGPQPLGRRYTDLASITHSTSYLRKVAVSAPSLWTHIDITDRPSSFEIAKACVQRSSPLNLDVSVRLASRIGARLQGVLALLEYVSTRTSTLQVTMFLPGEGSLNKAGAAFKDLKYPVLKKMEVDFRTKASRDNPRWNAPSFILPENAPNLQSVTLVDLAPALPPTPLSSLTRLVLNSPSFNSWPLRRVCDVLGQATALESLELVNRSHGDSRGRSFSNPSLHKPRTTFPNLHRLVLKGFDGSVITHLLFNIEAPELSDVGLQLSAPLGGNSGWNQVHVEHPFPSVSSLELLLSARATHSLHNQLSSFLVRIFPDIEELSMSLVGSWDVLQGLVNTWDSPANGVQECPRWPGLYHISIIAREKTCDRRCWERANVVGRFLVARSKMSLPPLEWVTLTLCDSVKNDEAFVPMVQDLRKVLASKNALELCYTTVPSSFCSKPHQPYRPNFASQ